MEKKKEKVFKMTDKEQKEIMSRALLITSGKQRGFVIVGKQDEIKNGVGISLSVFSGGVDRQKIISCVLDAFSKKHGKGFAVTSLLEAILNGVEGKVLNERYSERK